VAYNGWERIEPAIGSGGQGTVYKARSPEHADQRQQTLNRIQNDLRQVARSDDFSKLEELVMNIVNFGGLDHPSDLGALKILNIPRGGPEEDKALNRLQAEMKALGEINHPAVLRMLDGSHLAAKEQFIVTEYHPNGTLDKHLLRFKGRVLESLKAFRPLVDALQEIHSKDAIHRDIKPENIFMASDDRLVLGDFGIVFFKDGAANRQRLTTT
jgi:serine/threonine protein kinase